MVDNDIEDFGGQISDGALQGKLVMHIVLIILAGRLLYFKSGHEDITFALEPLSASILHDNKDAMECNSVRAADAIPSCDQDQMTAWSRTITS